MFPRSVRTIRLPLVATIVATAALFAPLGLSQTTAFAATGKFHSGVPLVPLVQPAAAAKYGAGKSFCNNWGGLSELRLQVSNVYPCSDPNTSDQWGTTQCADYSDRFEWVVYGLTAPINGGEVVRYLHSNANVEIQSPASGRLPVPGDVLSMWGNASTDPAGHTGVVYDVSVNAHGNGHILYLDQNGSKDGNRNIGEDTIYVNNWKFSTGWGGYYGYTNFDWTLQADPFPDGTFVRYGSTNYRMVGGAPMYLRSWAAVGGVHSFKTLTRTQFLSLRQYPSDGSRIYEASGPTKGTGYVFVGGAPLPVSSWAKLGNPPRVGIDPVTLSTHAPVGLYSHVRRYPINGSAVVVATGPATGSGYVFAGGAPLPVAAWGDVGNPARTSVDPIALNTYGPTGEFSHVRQYPAGGTAVFVTSGDQWGATYVFAGGAPLRVANWKNVGNPPRTGIDGVALGTFAASGAYSHVRAMPLDGTFLTTQAHHTYRVAGGYAFAISSCAGIGGCPSPALVDPWAIGHPGTHLSAVPADGTEVHTQPSDAYWTFSSGTRSSGTSSPGAVLVNDSSVSGFPIV